MSSGPAQIASPTHENIETAARFLKQGDVVGMPTETVYGLAGSAFNETALTKIFAVKERPTFDPLIIHVAPSAKSLRRLASLGLIDLKALSETARERAEKIIERFWPGPLTLILPKNPKVPDLATSGLNTVAVRMPAHAIAQTLIEAAGMPLAAPSANRFGRISPTNAQDVFDELGDRIPFILDGGRCDIGVESTVINIDPDGTLTQLRPGGVALAELETATGAKVADLKQAVPATTASAQVAPGQLQSHYAPKKRLLLLTTPLGQLNATQLKDLKTHIGSTRHIGLLMNQNENADVISHLTTATITTQVLSASGDASEAARRLFAALRELDRSPAELLIAEQWFENTGLGHAVADRLSRASSVKI